MPDVWHAALSNLPDSENMQTDPTIHRRDNGTIDIDIYRQRALMLRGGNTTRFTKVLARAIRSLIGVAAVVGICTVAPPRSAPPVCAYALYGALAAPSCPANQYVNNEPNQRRSS